MEQDWGKDANLKAQLDEAFMKDFAETKANYEALSQRDVFELITVDIDPLEKKRLQLSDAVKQVKRRK